MRIHWTLLEPDATDEEMMAMDKDGYVDVAADRASQITSAAEKLALEYVELSGELAGVVEWCVNHDGETLGDNPRQLAYAKRILAKAIAKRSE